MKFVLRLILVMLFIGTKCALAENWQQPWVEPRNAHEALNNSDEYAWRLFIALNWPADPVSGNADPSRKLGDNGAVVWEYWQNVKAIFLSRGDDPGAWAGVKNNDPVPAAERFEGIPLAPHAPTRHIVGGAMTKLSDPIASASHLDETRMNRASFEYIRSQQLYSLDSQLKRINSGGPIAFPAGAHHVKAQWRPISADQRSRYYSIEITLADGTRRLYGLTALHIATKDLPNWFWATFEHVNNPTMPGAKPWQLKSHDAFACGDGLPADCGKAPTNVGLEGTVWNNYRLRGTMTNFVDAQGNPIRLVNSQLESNVQQTSASCMTCHARATLTAGKGTPARLRMFDDETAHGSQNDSQRMDNSHGTAPHTGFIGSPKPEWFFSGEPTAKRYSQMDFVWSLEKAK